MRCKNRIRNVKHIKGKSSNAPAVPSDLCRKKEIESRWTVSFEESDNDATDKTFPRLSSSTGKNEISSSLLNEYNAGRNRSNTVLLKLRHDASILYNYHEAPAIFPFQADAFSKTPSDAVARAIIDAAVIAMKRCDDTISGRAMACDLLEY